MSTRLVNLAWILLEKFGLVLVSVFSFLVYAFTLTPAQMGIGALALAIVESVGVLLGNIVEDPLVRRKHLTPMHSASGFWFGGLTALASMLVLVGGVQWLASDVLFTTIIWLASLKILLVVMARPFIAQLRRQRNFRLLAARTLVGKLLGAACGIILAFQGFGAWAIVTQAIVMDVFSLMLLLKGRSFSLWLKPQLPVFYQLVCEGLPIGLRSLCKSSLIRGITIVLGMTSSAEAVGYFAFANRLVSLPSQAFSNGLLSYALPAIARRYHAGLGVSQFVNALSVSTTLVLLPLFFIAAGLAPSLIAGIFGDKWHPSIVIFQCLAVITGLRYIILFVPPTLAAAGRARVGLNQDMLNTLATLGFIYLLSAQLGVLAAVLALGVHLIFDLIIKLRALQRVTEAPSQQLLQPVVRIVLAASVMLLVTTYAQQWLGSALLMSLAAVFFGMLSFTLLMTLLEPRWYHNLKGLLLKQ